MSFAQNDIWRFAPLGFAGYWVHSSSPQHNIGLLSFYSPLASSESEFYGLFLFSTGYSPWFLGTMVNIERFILPYPNLISIEGLGTLPEHCLRPLGKLLGQLPIFRRDCSSLPGNWNVSRQGMPSHSIFDGSLFIAVPCLPHVRLGLMMLVTLTHHSYITVISL